MLIRGAESPGGVAEDTFSGKGGLMTKILHKGEWHMARKALVKGNGKTALLNQISNKGNRPNIITQEAVAKRAYELFLTRGGVSGHDQDDWFQAERLLVQEGRS